MRRRDLLFIGAALSMQACTSNTPTTLRPTLGPVPSAPSSAAPVASPPGPDAVPNSFSQSRAWPSVGIPSTITALHDHHLCGSIRRQDRSVEQMDFPVIVDLSTHTTRLLLLDDAGRFSTVEADLDEVEAEASRERPELGPQLLCGPAILDDAAAYLVVVAPKRSQERSTPELGVAHLVKVRLSDGQVEAAAVLQENFRLTFLEEELNLSFSTDHSSILIAATSLGSADFIGKNLSATDLSTQFDILDVMPSDISSSWPAGAAIHVHGDQSGSHLVMLKDGTSLETSGDLGAYVFDDFHLHLDATGSSVLRNLATGEEQQVTGLSGRDIANFRTPGPWTRRSTFVSIGGGESRRRLTVWTPGTSEPSLQWEEEHLPPAGAVVFQDVLLSGSPHVDDGALTLRRIDTAEVIATVPRSVFGNGMGITAWGIATGGVFLPADGWLTT
ncbi:hypothetical protein EII34_14300 [Arachnia propionica]|uniref:Uncharacterized protein n=1 Tax=Arachnia propionica TaxID=1750 RepID=A0A3P1T1P1_9ACTN|nr:hypothetical protein [Arachnia propionica]RRD03361.1 hypothetical protein EII34_14300 [Arachnia propionica]